MQRSSSCLWVGLLVSALLGRSAWAEDPVEPRAFPPATEPRTAEPRAGRPTEPALSAVIGKWSPTFYGFIQVDAVEDTTQSFNDLAGNTVIARPGTYAGEHPRLTMTALHSRFGFRFSSPEDEDVRGSGLVEVDFLGAQPTTTAEANIFTSPILRMRHAWFRLATPIVDVTVGQAWQLFGWQPYFHPNTVEIQGVPGEVYSRTPQVRLSHVFKGETVSVEVAAAAARPPQRDSAVPDLQAGARMTINGWKGLRTLSATGTAVDAAALGVSGAWRHFAVDNFSAQPTFAVRDTGWALSVDAMIPIVPTSTDDHANALVLTGSYVVGAADADFYSALNGGIGFPPLPNPTGAMPAPVYTPDIDNGLVTFNSSGALEAVKWWSLIGGLQYHLPPSGHVWISVNYSHMHSSNIAALGTPSAVFVTSNWFDGNLFWDATTAVRAGFEYAWFEQTYADDVKAHNSRFQLSGFYIF